MVQHSTARRGPPPEEGAAEVIFALLAAWRVELCLLAPPVALGVWSYLHFGPVCAGVAVTLLVLLVVVPAPNRHLLARILHIASVRRRLEMAFRSLPGVLSDRPPYVAKIVRTKVGDRVELGLRHGTSIEELERAEPIIAASLGVRDVRLVVDPARHDHVTLTITRRDPFESTALPCPLITAPTSTPGVPSRSGWTRKERSSPCPCPSTMCSSGPNPAAASRLLSRSW